MTLYFQQKVIEKEEKIDEILKFPFSTAVLEESAILSLVLQGIFIGDSENQIKY